MLQAVPISPIRLTEPSPSRADEWSKCGTLAGASPGAFGQQSRTSRLAATGLHHRPVVLHAVLTQPLNSKSKLKATVKLLSNHLHSEYSENTSLLTSRGIVKPPSSPGHLSTCARRAPCSMSSGHTHDMRKKTRQIQQLCTPHCAPAPELLAHPLDQFRDTLCCLLFWPGEEIEQRLPFRGQFVAHVF